MQRRYDLVVLGGGTAGIVAAKTAGRLGARVSLAERHRTGGDCLWTGCVPSKSLLAAAHTAHRMRTAGEFGIAAAEPDVNFPGVMRHVRAAIEQIAPVDSPAALAETGVEVVSGTAVFTGPRRLRIGDRTVRFRRALVATGGFPALPPVPGLAEAQPLTSDTVWQLEGMPERLHVLGAGPVGCELGQAFARLGSQVTIVEMAADLLPREEPEAGQLLARSLCADGVAVHTDTTATAVEADGSMQLHGPRGAITLPPGRILVATGRRPASDELGLDEAGVRRDAQGYITVDAKLRSSNRRIFAAGDVTGQPPFTHLAGMHGSVAATNALLAPARSVTLERLPWVTFTDPEIAHVGLTDAQARQRHGSQVRTRTLAHTQLDRAVTEKRTEGFTQVVLDAKGRVLGATIAAPRAGEMLAELTALMHRGGKLRELASVIHPYPTWGDGVWNAALAELAASTSSPAARRFGRAAMWLRRLLSP